VAVPEMATTEALLDRWRHAEIGLRKTEPDSLAWMLAKHVADEARQAFLRRLEEVAAEERE
jgi:hypothetical protein